MSQGSDHIDSTTSLRPYSVSGLAVVLAAIILAGCTRSSFLGRQFDDLTARYNTHYNANRTFNAAERKLLREDEPVDMDRYLLVFEVPAVTGRSAEFEQVIEKSADLLRKHPQSKWVDDALMLIGKSYFYQSNYVGAEQKFNEVIALASSLHDEAVFWQARTLVASQAGQAAEDLIRTALASENLEDKWRPRLHLLLGDLRTDVSDWDGAIAALETGLDDVGDGDLAARAEFLLGQLYETAGDYPAAVEAYRRVRERGPLYELSFAAMYSQHRVEGLHGDAAVALAGLQKMARDNKHFQYLDRIEYLRARVHAASDEWIAAREMLLDVLYPQPGQRATSVRGEVHYRLAEIDRDLTGDFHRAAAHFDTAASALRSTNVQNEVFTPDAIVDARATADIFASYRQVAERIEEMDSLLHLGSLDDDAFDEAVRRVREQLAVEAARAAAEIERRQAQSSFRRVASEAGQGAQSTQNTAGGGQAGRYGFLNHKDIRLVQEAFLSFRQIWGDRPLIPGWRREEVVLSTRSEQQEQLTQTEGKREVKSVGPTSTLNFLPPVDISRVPRDSASRADMRVERSAERYKLANILFLSMGLPDSAAHWYRLVIDESEDESVILRAKYAMAEVHQSLGDQDASDELMAQFIREHPESVFADRARVNLGIEIETEGQDSLEVALEQYRSAYERWNEGRLQLALDEMVRTAADFPHTPVAAKALLAGGVIFSEMARTDSLDLFGVIPISDSVFTSEEIARATEGLKVDSVIADSMEVGLDLAVLDSTMTDSSSFGAAGAGPTAVDTSDFDEPEASLTFIDSAKELPRDSAQVVSVDSTEFSRSEDQDLADQAVVQPEIPAKPDSALADSNTQDVAARDESEILKPTGRTLDADDREAVLQRRLAARAKRTGQDAAGDVVEPRRNQPDTLLSDEVVRNVSADTPDVSGRPPDSTAGEIDLETAGDQIAAETTADETAAEPAGDGVNETAPPDSVEDAGQIVEKVEPPREPPAWIDPQYFINDIIPQPLTLHALFASVENHFATSEYGERASTLRQGLIAYRDEAFAARDTTARQLPLDPIGSKTVIGVPDSSLVTVSD